MEMKTMEKKVKLWEISYDVVDRKIVKADTIEEALNKGKAREKELKEKISKIELIAEED